MQMILIVEDDKAISKSVEKRLHSEGFQTATAFDGPTAVELHTKILPDLVILDINLPGFDGIEVCKQIHRHHRTPVIMLTAKDEEIDMLLGLELGADDYITKPFSARELVVRVKSVLRRATGLAPAADIQQVASGLTINAATRRVYDKDSEVTLTATEFDLLKALADAKGSVLSRTQLLASVWGYRDGGGQRTVDSHIRSLRAKLTTDAIRTVHGVGYAISAPQTSFRAKP